MRAGSRSVDALDDVVIRDDVAGLVDHESGTARLLPRRHLDDAGRRARVEIVHGQNPSVAGERRRIRRHLVDHLADGGRRAAEAAGSSDDSHRYGGTRGACADEGRALERQPPHPPNAAAGGRCSRLRLR